MENRTNNKVRILTVVLYAYLAFLPVLSVLFMYFDKDIWNAYAVVFNHISPTLTFFYHFYCLIIFGVSGAAMGVIISNMPVPKNAFWILVLIFDPLIIHTINHFSGNELHFVDLIIFTLVFENVAIILAYSVLYFSLKDKFIVLILMFSGGMLISYFGIHTFDIIKNFNLYALISTSANLLFSTVGYYKVIEHKTITGKKANKLQGKFFIISTLMGVLAVIFLIFAYIFPVLGFFG